MEQVQDNKESPALRRGVTGAEQACEERPWREVGGQRQGGGWAAAGLLAVPKALWWAGPTGLCAGGTEALVPRPPRVEITYSLVSQVLTCRPQLDSHRASQAGPRLGAPTALTCDGGMGGSPAPYVD